MNTRSVSWWISRPGVFSYGLKPGMTVAASSKQETRWHSGYWRERMRSSRINERRYRLGRIGVRHCSRKISCGFQKLVYISVHDSYTKQSAEARNDHQGPSS